MAAWKIMVIRHVEKQNEEPAIMPDALFDGDLGRPRQYHLSG